MIHHIEFEQWLPFTINKVFLFFANPNNLPRIMPPATGTELTAIRLVRPPQFLDAQQSFSEEIPLAGAGSEIVTSFRLFPFLPVRAQWIALITQFKWNHHFADVQKKGPFKSFQHRHEFLIEMRDGVSGTVVRDAIEYDAGFGPLGDLAQKVFIAPILRRIFHHRQQMLEKLLG